MNRPIWAVTLVVATFALAACGGGKEIEKVEAQDVLKILRSDKFEILDPQASSSGGDVAIVSQMYEGLVRAPAIEGGPITVPKWEPSLATDWKIEDSARVYTFTLRQGVKFHDGAELDADAVKRSFERLLVKDHPAAPTKRPYAGDLADISKMDVVDARTIRFTLRDSNPRFLANVSLHAAFIISPRAIDEMTREKDAAKRQAWLIKNTAGTGPYRIAKADDYRGSESVTLTAFDDYWGGKPRIGLLSFTTMTDHKSRREQIVAGAAGFTDTLLPSDWDDLGKNKDVTLFTWDAINIMYLAMNCDQTKNFPTKDKRVRDAIAMAIDRAPFVERYYGAAKPAHVLIPYTMPFGFPRDYKPKTDTLSREDALAKAKALVKEAGADGSVMKLILPEVPRPYLLYPRELADLIRQQLEPIGLKIELEPRKMAEIGEMIPKGDYPLMLLGWMGDNGEPDNFWRPLLDGDKDENGNWKPGDNNLARFFHPEVHARIEAAGREADISKRDRMYKELEMWAHDEFRPIVPLLTAKKSYCWSAKLKGVRVDTGDQFYLDKAYYEK
ncbi:MAG: hypothetical protein HS108_14295 [Planctomycetes bacterium]|nr:hypothetical protein [Planctomycetota bacterium]MCL4729299.1 hypothetical protein [Planctomycetota bacterium]